MKKLSFWYLLSIVPVVFILVIWCVIRGKFDSAKVILFEHHLPAWKHWLDGIRNKNV